MASIIIKDSIDENLKLKLEKFQFMKWLLDIENNSHEVIYEEVQNKVNQIAAENIVYLTEIYQLIILLPKAMKRTFSKLNKLVNNKRAYSKLYEKFKLDLKYKSEFSEFERFVNLQVNYQAETNNIFRIEGLKEQKIYNILLFNILDGFVDYSYFSKENFIYNFPVLYKWILEYQNKPIEVLTEDECKILTEIYTLKSYKTIIETFDLSIANQNYEAISHTISELPSKFGVNNLVQVIFRIILLKPYLFELYDNDLIIKGLRELKNALPQYRT